MRQTKKNTKNTNFSFFVQRCNRNRNKVFSVEVGVRRSEQTSALTPTSTTILKSYFSILPKSKLEQVSAEVGTSCSFADS